jgi:hypothetical protein
MKILLNNDVHKTATIVNVEKITETKMYLSDESLASVKKALCGIDGCNCSNRAGMAGNNAYRLYPVRGGAYLIAKVK